VVLGVNQSHTLSRAASNKWGLGALDVNVCLIREYSLSSNKNVMEANNRVNKTNKIEEMNLLFATADQ
jgi:hypothetical protein